MVDLGDDDCPFAAETVIERLAQVKTVLVGQPPAEETDAAIKHVKTLLVANKIDLPESQDRIVQGRKSNIHSSFRHKFC